MTSIQVRTMNEQVFRYAGGDPAVETESASRTGSGTCTGNGASGGTTLVDTGGVANSGSADTYNGHYWVRMLSGDNQGEMKRVVDDDGSGTLTLEGNGFTNQVDSGDDYEIWQMPDPGVVVVDTGTSTTVFNDDTRDEDDTHWVGYYAVFISGSLRGEIQKVTGFDKTGGSTEGEFTTDAFSGTPSSGDVALLRKYVEVGNFSGGYSQEYHPRRGLRQKFQMGAGTVGAKGSGPLTFETDVVAAGTQAAAGSNANPSVLNHLLTACGLTEVINKALTIDDASATVSQIDISTGTHENVRLDTPVMYKGNVAWVTGKTDNGASPDTLDVSPDLPVAPADTDTLHAFRGYLKTTDGDEFFAIIEMEQDGIRHTFFNCRGSYDFQDGQPNSINWSFTYEHYTREDEADPSNPQDATTQPYTTTSLTSSHEKIVYLDTTKVDVGGLTASPDITVQPRNVSGRFGINGRAGNQVVNARGGATFNETIESSGDLDRELDFHQQTDRDFMVVWDSFERCVALRIPVAHLVEAPHPQDIDNGLMGTPGTWEAHDAGVATDPADGTVKKPDWALFLAG